MLSMVDSMVAVMSTKEGSISSHQEEEYKSLQKYFEIKFAWSSINVPTCYRQSSPAFSVGCLSPMVDSSPPVLSWLPRSGSRESSTACRAELRPTWRGTAGGASRSAGLPKPKSVPSLFNVTPGSRRYHSITVLQQSNIMKVAGLYMLPRKGYAIMYALM